MKTRIDEWRRIAIHLSSQLSNISPSWRVAALVIGVLFALGVIATSRVDPRPKTELLYAGRSLSSHELDQMTQAFAKSKLTGYTVSNGQIHVPTGQADQFLQSLADNSAFPRAFDHKDLAIKSTNLLEREPERRRRLLRALEQDLAFAIRTMPEINDAYVHYDETEERGLKRSRITTASVCVVPSLSSSGANALSHAKIHAIRMMVASARAGMVIDDVNLTDLGSGRSYGGAAVDVGDVPHALLARSAEIEENLAQKVRTVLRMVPRAEVVVGVQLPKSSASASEVVDLSSFARVAISVSVPRSYFESLYVSRRRESADANLTLDSVTANAESRIRNAILGAIPAQHSQPSITVTTFDDLAAAASPASKQRLTGQLRNWSAAVALIIAALGVLVVHLISRRQAATASVAATHRIYRPTEEPEQVVVSEAEEIDDETALRATLTDLVREDPDRAARVLNQWIAKAG